MTEQALEAVEQIHPLVAVGVARFIEQGPEQGKGNTFMDDAQHQDVDVERAEGPVGAVETERPGFGDASEPHQGSGYLVRIDLKLSKETLESLMGRVLFGVVGKGSGNFREVDRADAEQGDEEQSEEVESGTVPGQVTCQGRLQSVNLFHEGAEFGLWLFHSTLSLAFQAVNPPHGLVFSLSLQIFVPVPKAIP